MDRFKRNNPLNSHKNLKGSELQQRKNSSNKVVETNMNEPHFVHKGAPTMSKTAGLKKIKLFSKTSPLKKKILAERNEEPLQDSCLSSNLEITPQSKGNSCANPCEDSFQNTPISSHSYDPITNYTSPRPKFLRYNPIQRRELLKRIEGEKMGKEEMQSEFFLSSPNSLSEKGNDSDHEKEEEEEEEVEEEEKEFEEKPFSSFVIWSLVFLFGVSLFISYSMGRGSYTSFEGNESYANDIQKDDSRLAGKKLISLIFLGSLMSSSQMCPILRESFCNPEENLFSTLREHLGEGIGNELCDRTEVQDLVLENGGMIDDDSVDQNQRDFGPLAEENVNKSITSVETLIEENNITSSRVESSLVSVVQEVSDSSFTVQEDRFHNKSLDSTEFSLISHSRFPNLENLNFSSASETELKLDFSSSFSSGVLLTFLFFLGSFTIAIGSLIYFHKYFRRMKFKSPPSSEFCRKTETGEEMITEGPMKEENLEKALNMSEESKSSSLNPVSSNYEYSNVELKNLSRFESPRVELLGELSLMDAMVTTDSDFGLNLIKMENPNSPFSYNQNGTERKMLSPLSKMLDSSPLEKSTSSTSRFSSKVHWDKSEVSDSSTTSSLRRSSRLRSRSRAFGS